MTEPVARTSPAFHLRSVVVNITTTDGELLERVVVVSDRTPRITLAAQVLDYLGMKFNLKED